MTSVSPADLSVGSFSNTPPWLVDPDDLPWRTGAGRACGPPPPPRSPPPAPADASPGPAGPAGRGRAGPGRRRLVPDRTAPGPPAGPPGAVPGRPVAPAAHRVPDPGADLHQAGPDPLLGRGPLPPELVSQFRLLRDRVPPEPFEASGPWSRRTWAGRSRSSSAVSTETPLAAASIAQVHAATLRTGEEVVVKVQRPAVATTVRTDLATMSWIAPTSSAGSRFAALANPPALVELFAETIVEELDFRLEADNMLDIAGVLATTGQRSVVVPRPHPEARHPPGPRHGAAGRFLLRGCGRHAGRRHRHRGRGAGADDLLPRGRRPLRGVPR